MILTKPEILEIIDQQTIKLKNCGTDNFPGHFLTMDEDQIEIEGEILSIFIYAWTEKENKSERIKNYVINYRHNYIIMDHFYEAVSVWEHILNEFKVK